MDVAQRLAHQPVGVHAEDALEGRRDVEELAAAAQLDDELAGALQKEVQDRRAAVRVDLARGRTLVEHEDGPGGERLVRLGAGIRSEHRAGDDPHPDGRSVPGQHVVLEDLGERHGCRAGALGAGAGTPPGHEVVPIGAELLVARSPQKVKEGAVGGEQHGVGCDHAERLLMRQVADHLDELSQLGTYGVRHAPVEPVTVLQHGGHPPSYRRRPRRR